MSRIGKNPINITQGVEVNVSDDKIISVKGPKGALTQKLDDAISLSIENGVITVARRSESKEDRSKHGLYRSLINNMINGVSEGFKIEQELIGVGYRAKEQIKN